MSEPKDQNEAAYGGSALTAVLGTRLPDWHKHTESEYTSADPFQGDEAELKCRTVTLRKARKDHLCYGLNGKQDHGIQAGQFYRHERALVDGSFFGEYRICLPCMDALIEGRY